MRRLALPLALLLPACGDDPVGTTGFTTTGVGTTTTGDLPTTSGDASTSAGTSTSSASDSATGTTTGDLATTSSPGLDATSHEDSGTTVESTGDGTTDADSTTTSSTGTTGTTGPGTTTADSTTGSEVDVPPVPGGACNLGQGELTTFVDPMPPPDELHIVAMYQATANAATVTISRTGVPLTLFLSSYEPVAFTLVVAPGVQLEHVILDGYNMHTIQGQGPAMVTDISGNFGDPHWVACGYFWPMNDGGCDTPGNVAAAEALTGLQLTTFAGCYEGISFTLD